MGVIVITTEPTFECPAIADLFVDFEVEVTTRWRRGFVTTVVQIGGHLRSREAAYRFMEHEQHGVFLAWINGVRHEVFYERPELTHHRSETPDYDAFPYITLTTAARLERRLHPVVAARLERKKRDEN